MSDSLSTAVEALMAMSEATTAMLNLLRQMMAEQERRIAKLEAKQP